MAQRRINKLTAAGFMLVALPWLAATAAQAQDKLPELDDASVAVEGSFPAGPERTLVLEHCTACHGLDWIARSGGTEDGWVARIRRMIRSGSTIPRDRVQAVAAYLAEAFPVRPRPAEDASR